MLVSTRCFSMIPLAAALLLAACASPRPAAPAPPEPPDSTSADFRQDADFIDPDCIVTPRPVINGQSAVMEYDYTGNDLGDTPMMASIFSEGPIGDGLTLSVTKFDPASTAADSADMDRNIRHWLEVSWKDEDAYATVRLWKSSIISKKAKLKLEQKVRKIADTDLSGVDPPAGKLAPYMPHVFGSAHRSGYQYVYVQVGTMAADPTVREWVRLKFTRR